MLCLNVYSLLAQTESIQLTFLFYRCPGSLSVSQMSHLQLNVCPFYFFRVFLSILLTYFYFLHFFPNNLRSLTVSCLLSLPLDLWLIVFNPVYDTQTESSHIKGVC